MSSAPMPPCAPRATTHDLVGSGAHQLGVFRRPRPGAEQPPGSKHVRAGRRWPLLEYLAMIELFGLLLLVVWWAMGLPDDDDPDDVTW